MSRGWLNLQKWTAPSRALLLAVLALALAGQALLVSAHRHEPGGRSAAALSSRTGGDHDGHGCTICEMQRVGGHYLPAVDQVLALAMAAVWLVGACLGRPLPRFNPMLGWRSRAPPVSGLTISA